MLSKRKSLLLVIVSLLLGAQYAQARGKTLRTMKNLDLTRYQGQWHEIARLPNWFERKCSKDITAVYRIQKDGDLEVVNRCTSVDGEIKEARGIGRVAKPGHLKVTFAPKLFRAAPFVWADYCVVYIDDDYKRVIVGEPRRHYLWFLARTNSLTEDEYQHMVEIASNEGFDTSRLIRISPDCN